MAWIAASLDEKLGDFCSKRDTMNALFQHTSLPQKSRRIEEGLYEVVTLSGATYWIMSNYKAKLNGFE